MLTAVEFSDRYKHLAYGARTGLQSDAERRGADAGGRRADGRESGRRDDRTDGPDMKISRGAFLAFSGSEGRSIVKQSYLSRSAISLCDDSARLSPSIRIGEASWPCGRVELCRTGIIVARLCSADGKWSGLRLW